MFTYKGKSSKEMHLRVLNDISFSSPSRDVNMIQVPGRDGDLIMDNGRFESVIRSIPCRLAPPPGTDVEQLINEINNWLIDNGGFHEFKWNHDPEFKYLARVEGDVVSQRMLSRFGKSTIDFRLHPIKYLETSLEESIGVTNGTVVVNPFAIDAKPIIRIVGHIPGREEDEDTIINIGGRPLRLRGITDGCIINSETQTITSLDGRVTLFSQMRSPFPVLKPGNNQVTFSASGIQVLITRRLGALV